MYYILYVQESQIIWLWEIFVSCPDPCTLPHTNNFISWRECTTDGSLLFVLIWGLIVIAIYILMVFSLFFYQCTINGVKFDKLQKGSGKNVTRLEMFFSGFPQIIGMDYFPNLQSLTLMGQQIADLENLECLPNLTELCVSESKLTVSGIQIKAKNKM